MLAESTCEYDFECCAGKRFRLSYDRTQLRIFTLRGLSDSLYMLLIRRVEIDAVDMGEFTSLVCACANDYIDAVNMLADTAASFTGKGRSLQCPLYRAAVDHRSEW